MTFVPKASSFQKLHLSLTINYFFHVPDSYVMSNLRAPSKSPSADSSETAMYVTLSLYLMSVIIPLVVVWTVNMCTVQAYRKNLTVSFIT